MKQAKKQEALLEENRIVHGLWIGNKLSLLEQLTIKLLQSHGHEFHLWSYDSIEGVPEGTVLEDAEEILPRSSIFAYFGHPNPYIPNGGIGSLSHWSDQFQIALLYKRGGIYIQLDVAVLEPLNFTKPFAFAPLYWNGNLERVEGISAFIMKAPKGHSFLLKTHETLSQSFHKETTSEMYWESSMISIFTSIKDLIHNWENLCIDGKSFLDLGGLSSSPYNEPHIIPEEIKMIHWSNATHNQTKDKPIPNSTYWQLLKQTNLI